MVAGGSGSMVVIIIINMVYGGSGIALNNYDIFLLKKYIINVSVIGCCVTIVIG
jgi:hypothetical protein